MRYTATFGKQRAQDLPPKKTGSVLAVDVLEKHVPCVHAQQSGYLSDANDAASLAPSTLGQR
jgi:hypothetical protein